MTAQYLPFVNCMLIVVVFVGPIPCTMVVLVMVIGNLCSTTGMVLLGVSTIVSE
jgi:hypothetical protein